MRRKLRSRSHGGDTNPRVCSTVGNGVAFGQGTNDGVAAGALDEAASRLDLRHIEPPASPRCRPRESNFDAALLARGERGSPMTAHDRR